MRALAILLVAGCGFQGSATPDDDVTGDAAVVDGAPGDAPVPSDAPMSDAAPSPDAPLPPCYGTGTFQVCPRLPPSGSRTMSGGVIDTDNPLSCVELVGPNADTVCAQTAQAWTLG